MPNGFWFVYGGTAAGVAGSWALTLFIAWLNHELSAALGVEPSHSEAYVFFGVLAVAMAALTGVLLRFVGRTP